MTQKNTDKAKLIPHIGIRDTGTLSKLQQQFNAKIKKIHELKASLTQTEVSMRLARERVQQELQPTLKQIITHKIEMVKLLDRSYGLTFFRKKEKEKLAQLIEDMSYELIDNHGVEELIGLHDKYAQMTHAEATEMGDDLARDLAQDLLKGMFGVDVEIKDFNDFEHIQAQIEQQLGGRKSNNKTRGKPAGRKPRPNTRKRRS